MMSSLHPVVIENQVETKSLENNEAGGVVRGLPHFPTS